MVADAEGEVAQGETLAVADEAEDHAELAVRRRQVDLEAARQFRVVGDVRGRSGEGS